MKQGWSTLGANYQTVGTLFGYEYGSVIVRPMRLHSAECSLLGVSLRATYILQRTCGRQRHRVGQRGHQHLSPKPGLEPGTACSTQSWLTPKVYKQQVLLMWGSWQTQREEGKTGHPYCPAG